MSRGPYLRDWRKTPRGVLQQAWFNFLRKIKNPNRPCYGVPCCTREEFYDWALDNNDFNMLYSNWTKSGYKGDLRPTVNRIVGPIGFVPTNLEWVTQSESRRRGASILNGGY